MAYIAITAMMPRILMIPKKIDIKASVNILLFLSGFNVLLPDDVDIT